MDGNRPTSGRTDGATVRLDSAAGDMAGDGGTTATTPATMPSERGEGDAGLSRFMELCGNGLDDDDDGEIEEGCDCAPDSTQRCYLGDPTLAGVGVCTYGRMRCVEGVEFGSWGGCVSFGAPEIERCDGLDNDCDGALDEGCECTPGAERVCYDGPSATLGVGICRSGVQNCNATSTGSQLGACTGQTLPSSEICEGRTDEDCDGWVDEGCACPIGEDRTCYPGPLGTAGVGRCRQGSQRCEASGSASEWGVCQGATLPSAEQCGVAGDEDCDGADDCDDPDCSDDPACGCPAGAVRECFPGAASQSRVGVCMLGQEQCIVTSNGWRQWSGCVGATVPGLEQCDGVDNDCDGATDEGCECLPGSERRCYTGPARTAGVGICRTGTESCSATASGSMFGVCQGQVVPRAEICEGRDDEDCDGRIDEGCGCTVGQSRSCYGGPSGTRDVGICRAGSQICSTLANGQAGWSVCSGGQSPRGEICTGGLDENCDGRADCADAACSVDRACCTPFEERLAVAPDADILFVVDRSGSMAWEAEGTTRSRWLEMIDGMAAVLPELDELRLGLLTFPYLDGTNERDSCRVGGAVDVPLAQGHGLTILDRLRAAIPRAGDTPTPRALLSASGYLETIARVRPRFVVLVTDGLPEPKCDSPPGLTDDPVDREAMLLDTLDAITALGIDVFVLGIVGPNRVAGGRTDASIIPALRSALDRMAIAGGRPRGGSGVAYYEANNGAALTRALRTVLGEATECSFSLSRVPTRPMAVEVFLDGFRVPSTSWSIFGSSITLSGGSCDRVRSGLSSVLSVRDTCSQ